jgi:transcriptional regulator with XRE-family HTH domain
MGDHFNEGARQLWGAVESLGGQRQAAEKIGADVTALNRWLYGDRKPSREFASKIADALGIPVNAWDLKAKRGFKLAAAERTEAA